MSTRRKQRKEEDDEQKEKSGSRSGRSEGMEGLSYEHQLVLAKEAVISFQTQRVEELEMELRGLREQLRMAILERDRVVKSREVAEEAQMNEMIALRAQIAAQQQVVENQRSRIHNDQQYLQQVRAQVASLEQHVLKTKQERDHAHQEAERHRAVAHEANSLVASQGKSLDQMRKEYEARIQSLTLEVERLRQAERETAALNNQRDERMTRLLEDTTKMGVTEAGQLKAFQQTIASLNEQVARLTETNRDAIDKNLALTAQIETFSHRCQQLETELADARHSTSRQQLDEHQRMSEEIMRLTLEARDRVRLAEQVKELREANARLKKRASDLELRHELHCAVVSLTPAICGCDEKKKKKKNHHDKQKQTVKPSENEPPQPSPNQARRKRRRQPH
eukprot:TRINITY_DN66421_c3_g1_i1.p1 TRINITY_DN66421_c3_g1~~TRINITY_DN66421_c3_g1_i1.p1  ORF type:complete len:394 (-),score=224.32 TRINITY_DN66421_c3_g1_i1:317-1498(-)